MKEYNENGTKHKYTDEEVRNHMLGRVYINKDDLNIFVKRKGVGSWTMNLGNKWSWAIMAAELIAVGMLIYIFIINI